MGRVAGVSMEHVTQILTAAQGGDQAAAAQLLPLVYDELRRLAALKIAHETPGHTLSATALVHEAYLRLVGDSPALSWNHRGHFYAAAAEAMRRILVEHARRRNSQKRGGGKRRVPLDDSRPAPDAANAVDLVALDDALTRLQAEDPVSAQLVQLRYFSGLTTAETAECLGLSVRTAERLWTFARAWLHREMSGA
jgi:RNA polymerase sigma factor (TIGR02999 family)